MSTYIQVNIYNQTLEVLKMRGLDLQSILKTIGCPDSWVTEVPIHPPAQKIQKPATPPTSCAPQLVSSPKCLESISAQSQNVLKKPFKSISAELGFAQPLNLVDTLGLKPRDSDAMSRGKRPASVLKGLFDDWDPTANLDIPGRSSDIPSDPSSALKVPKKEVLDESEEILDQTSGSSSFSLNDSEQANEQERNIIEDLLRQQMFTESKIKNEEASLLKGLKKGLGEELESSHANYVITCNFPGCGLKYNWRVKYGKLRLLDHALTHSNRKIPCKLCGFECTNVRRMRSHYAKAHPNERVEGYGMKALVSGDSSRIGDGVDGDIDQQVSDDELKELWNNCFSESIHLVGQASGFVEGEKYRRMTKRRKLDREAMNSMNFMF